MGQKIQAIKKSGERWQLFVYLSTDIASRSSIARGDAIELVVNRPGEIIIRKVQG